VNVVVVAGEPLLQPARADDPVEVDHTQPVRVDVFGGQGEHALRRRAQLGLVLGRPRVQARGKRLDHRRKLRALARRPLFRERREAVGADPLVIVQKFLPIELRAAPARLGVEADQQLGVGLHLGVSVGVEQALVIGREDVGHTVAVPEDLGPFGRQVGRAAERRRREAADEQQAEDQDGRDARRSELTSHESPPCAGVYQASSRRLQAPGSRLQASGFRHLTRAA
jgi:hypothetical protein